MDCRESALFSASMQPVCLLAGAFKPFTHEVIINMIFFFFLGPYQQYMEAPRLGVKLELYLLACTTATATQEPSCICDYTPAHSIARSLTEQDQGSDVRPPEY